MWPIDGGLLCLPEGKASEDGLGLGTKRETLLNCVL